MRFSSQSGRATAVALAGLVGSALLIGGVAMRSRIFGGTARAATPEQTIQAATRETLNELLAHDDAEAAICERVHLTWRELFSTAQNFTNEDRNAEILAGLREWTNLERQYSSTDFLRENLQQRLAAADLPLVVTEATLRTFDDRLAPVAQTRARLSRERLNALLATKTAYEYARDHVCKPDSSVIYLDGRDSLEFFRERLDQAHNNVKSLVPLEQEYASARAALLASYALPPRSGSTAASRSFPR